MQLAVLNGAFCLLIVFIQAATASFPAFNNRTIIRQSINIRGRLKRSPSEETEAWHYLSHLNIESSKMCYKDNVADWRYESHITDHNEQSKMDQALASARFAKEAWNNITTFRWRTFNDTDLWRRFSLLSVLDESVLPEEKYSEYLKQIDEMTKIYSTAKICTFHDPHNCSLTLDPEITDIMSNSRNFEELKHVWTEWHRQSGGRMRHQYEHFVRLSNEAARLNNFSDTGAFWLRNYESDTFKQDIEHLWQTLRPFYQQLHAYVRARLRIHYGEDKVPKGGPIPAHLLGDMWAQSWTNIDDVTLPYPGKTSIDVTAELIKQGYTPFKMFQKANAFFKSMGLIPVTSEFWEESIIEKPPPDHDMVCHASAWDFCTGRDFRIKMCTQVNMDDFVTIHHEMGHIQYYMQYRHQPLVYRQGANSGFHEAVGDTLSLSVRTTKHLKEIGLLDKSTPTDREATINYLFSMAMDKLAFFPFAYLMDKWRWDVFDGTVSSDDYNCHWWKLREEYQGVRAPVMRSENDFDPGAKFHIAANVEYIRYFVSFVIQFQFYRSLCITAGQYDPSDPTHQLHDCDFYRNKAAGHKLAHMLSMGTSKPWPEAMKAVTGQEKMDASAFLEYFKPLEAWLINKNKELNETVGWALDGMNCKPAHS